MSKIIDAVSIVMTCGDEIFAIQRQFFLNAFPGYWAFPGGKVEAFDEFIFSHELVKDLDKRLLGAVAREGKEELGIDLSHELERGTVSSISYLGLAVTPDFNPYRFATYFFKIDLKEKLKFDVDRNEARIAEWMSAERLLEAYNSGNILAVPPVIKVIQELGKNPHVKHIEELNLIYDGTIHVPMIESIRGLRQFMPLSNTLPPAVRTNAFLIGDDVKILIDPSPKDDEEYQKLKSSVAMFGVDKILITHHHPDHYERSNSLAKDFNVPILLSRYTFDKIIQKESDYFQNVRTTFVKEGDVVTKWLGEDVLVMEIPGHDEGQIALYPQTLKWFLAGDLFQGIGTVVIGGEEGDMQKYFETLERIIKLSPAVVFPSHGIGLGGTTILEKTLKHRKEREAQILSLYSEGITPEEMLAKIYHDVDRKLWPYALENIHKHLVKLRREKAIS
jgi:glyoxylase-like metal-dependent hydrolase (beta-lactamase superfamily II)/8-oxo-dGTP pyrophosphatase MutT (NUDIX family)